VVGNATGSSTNVGINLTTTGTGVVKANGYEVATTNTGSAVKLTTARNINGVAFDGTAAITVWQRSIASVTSSTTLGSSANTDYVALIGSGGAPTLPTAVSNTNRYTIKNTHTASITLSTTSSQTIDGSTTFALIPNASIDVVSDGANWRII
jgi:hypothetical protein